MMNKIGTYAQWEIDKHMSKREKNKILKKTLEESPLMFFRFKQITKHTLTRPYSRPGTTPAAD